MNGVFLVALCLSIFLDAIQRFVEPQEVSNPRLVLIVGCFGLGSNILGLLLFHDHGHSHGHGHGHGHGHEEGEHTHHTDELGTAENGLSETPIGGHTNAISDESGNIADVLPQVTVGGWPKSDTLKQASRESTTTRPRRKSHFTASDEDDTTVQSTLTGSTSPNSRRKSSVRHSRRSGSRSLFPSVDEISGHPSSFRRDFIAASRLDDIESHPDDSGYEEYTSTPLSHSEEAHDATESSPLLPRSRSKTKTSSHSHQYSPNHEASHLHPQDSDALHEGHHHCGSKENPAGGGGGHSHSDLNMRGVFLHVMGDALGNIGVISSALIIWLTTFPQRFYIDPAISLIITIIILTSAIPLCKAASRILLQAVPDHISVDEIKSDIEDLPGIISCHHLHVWQLSDVKLVASLHIQVEFDFKGEGSARYMKLAKSVRRCLHEFGIHSSTIQPEFCLDEEHQHAIDTDDISKGDRTPNGNINGSKTGSKKGSRAPSMHSQPDACLLDCSDSCAQARMCCPTNAGAGQDNGSA